MFYQGILVYNAIHITARDVAAIFYIVRIKFPGNSTRECRYIDAFRDVDRVCELVDIFQWTLNTIKNAAEDTRTQFDR